jgi:hypothetical protein
MQAATGRIWPIDRPPLLEDSQITPHLSQLQASAPCLQSLGERLPAPGSVRHDLPPCRRIPL